jgi:hypothetical protein
MEFCQTPRRARFAAPSAGGALERRRRLARRGRRALSGCAQPGGCVAMPRACVHASLALCLLSSGRQHCNPMLLVRFLSRRVCSLGRDDEPADDIGNHTWETTGQEQEEPDQAHQNYRQAEPLGHDPELRPTAAGRPGDLHRLHRVARQLPAQQALRQQSRQWTPEGAHLLLQVRTRMLNGELTDTFRGWYPAFSLNGPACRRYPARRLTAPVVSRAPDCCPPSCFRAAECACAFREFPNSFQSRSEQPNCRNACGQRSRTCVALTCAARMPTTVAAGAAAGSHRMVARLARALPEPSHPLPGQVRRSVASGCLVRHQAGRLHPRGLQQRPQAGDGHGDPQHRRRAARVGRPRPEVGVDEGVPRREGHADGRDPRQRLGMGALARRKPADIPGHLVGDRRNRSMSVLDHP